MQYAAMTCRQLIDSIADYAANELGGEERRDFEEHLAHCVSCLAYLDSYRITIELVRLMLRRAAR